MNLPTREECEGWDQAQVALFMSKNKMPDCANVVHRLRINGKKLLNLSSTDMSKFSIIHQPQLQKIVQDIRKNDGSLLDKLKRLKTKPVPKVPARDYRAEDSDDQASEPDYDNEMYEVPEEHDDSYMPPPSHRDFTKPPPVSYQRGEYIDNCHNRPERPPKKPFHLGKASKQLPPEPPQVGSDEEDYINPNNDDDNYVEPEESPPPKPVQQGRSRSGRDLPWLPSALSGTLNPGVNSVSDREDSPVRFPSSRLCSTPPRQSASLPPKPGPRINMKTHVTVQEPTGEDEYEVCDPSDDCSTKPPESPPSFRPKPLPRERSPKPLLKPKPGPKPWEVESRTLPMTTAEPKPSPGPFTLDMKRPKIPLPQFTSPRAADRGSVSAEDEPANPDKDADVYRKSWYANTCDRKTADEVLYRTNKDGAFMVRKSSGQDTQQPYTLVVFYKGRVYNIPIRFIPANKQYALGSEKKGEEYFNSVAHIIENHKRIPLVLIDSQSNSKDSTKLCHPVKP